MIFCLLFLNIRCFVDNLLAVSPFIDRLPHEIKGMYLDDLVKKLAPKYQDPLELSQGIETITIPYQSLVAYASKAKM